MITETKYKSSVICRATVFQEFIKKDTSLRNYRNARVAILEFISNWMGVNNYGKKTHDRPVILDG
jgi:hypothetical protein